MNKPKGNIEHKLSNVAKIPECDVMERWLSKSHASRLRKMISFIRAHGTTEIIRMWQTEADHCVKWSTVCGRIGQIFGIAKRYPELVDHLDLAHLKDFQRRAMAQAREQEPTVYTLKKQELETAVLVALLRKETLAATVLILAWSTASRIGDVLSLNATPNEILIGENVVRVKFLRGKGAQQRGQPYTVEGTLPAQHVGMMRATLRNMMGAQLNGAPRIRKQIASALKSANKQATFWSVRRGSLTRMAGKGVHIDILQQMAGHKAQEMTLRYLNWGWTAKQRLQQQRKATAKLW